MISQPDKPVLVIGYGSTLRGDDSIGRLVAERIANSALPNVVVISTTQLVPELATRIAAARAVIFVDAQVTSGVYEVEVEEITPLGDPRQSTHVAGPRQMLALTLDCYGFAPRAWIVAVPVASLVLTDRLSPGAHRHFVPAVDAVEKLVNQLLECEPANA
jgi:hydrogenase maturation protease